MTYPASQTCKLISSAKGPWRVHELGADAKARCAAYNTAAHSNNYAPRGPGTVDCLRCAESQAPNPQEPEPR